MEIFVTGSVLRDKDDTSKRNYVNIVVSAKDAKGKVFYHIGNYQANSKSRAHRMILNQFDSHEEAMSKWESTQKKKLGRNRVETTKIMDEFSSLKDFEKALTDVLYRITVVNVRKLKNRIESDLSRAMEEAELSFDEHIERKIADAGDFARLEKEAGVGKETAEIAGGSWGLF